MAPMAGVTTAPFRASVRRWGAGLVYTEMVSACGVHYGNRRTLDYLACRHEEHPIGFQLFGATPEVLADAAAVCVQAGADLIDINMACPVRKVVKTGAGAALMGEPRLAADIVRAVVRAAGPDVPVTVKMRAGLRDGDEAWRELALRVEDAGAAALCVHPRSAGQLYRGHADHAVTRALAAEAAVPVIASGDVDGREAALSLLDDGAAAVMLARHALGRPWLFAEVLEGAPPPTAEARLTELRAFAADVFAHMGARGVGHLRQFWPRFRRSGTIAKGASLELMRAATEEEVRRLLSI
jgi:tRNA-dihydrouridine synthase B